MEEKYCGLQTLALMIESPENVQQVLDRGLVKVAAPLLMDPASSVRNAAAGTLRNLSTVAMDTCDAMMEQDVMTPVTCYFHEVLNCHAQYTLLTMKIEFFLYYISFSYYIQYF